MVNCLPTAWATTDFIAGLLLWCRFWIELESFRKCLFCSLKVLTLLRLVGLFAVVIVAVVEMIRRSGVVY